LLYLSNPNVYSLINYTSFSESLFVTFSVAALLWLRYKRPNMERPIKVHIILPIFFFIVCGFLVLLPVFEQPFETGISALITLTGIPIYYITIGWKNKPAAYERINGKFFIKRTIDRNFYTDFNCSFKFQCNSIHHPILANFAHHGGRSQNRMSTI
jgi:amino acid transporter